MIAVGVFLTIWAPWACAAAFAPLAADVRDYLTCRRPQIR